MNDQLLIRTSDRDSVYSFDSVSTNERLLDRLDFDNESIRSTRRESYYNGDSRMNDSNNNGNNIILSQALQQQQRHHHHHQPLNTLNALRNLRATPQLHKQHQNQRLQLQNAIQNTVQDSLDSRPWDGRRLPVDTNQNLRFRNKDGPSNNYQNQYGNYSQASNINRLQNQPITNPKKEPQIKIVAANPVYGNTNNSTETIRSKMALLKETPIPKSSSNIGIDKTQLLSGNDRLGGRSLTSTQSSSDSLQTLGTITDTSSFVTANSIPFQYQSNPTSSIPISEMEYLTVKENENDQILLFEKPLKHHFLPHSVSRSSSDQTVKTISTFDTQKSSRQKRLSLDLLYTSPNSSRSNSGSSLPLQQQQQQLQFQQQHHSHPLHYNQHQHQYQDAPHAPASTNELDPVSRTVIAMELRALNKHREASYQLQIAANEPHNYPKAMYLYAMALKYGQGVKQNHASAIRWLCKCILIGSISSSSSSSSSFSDDDDKNDDAPGSTLSYKAAIVSKLNKLEQQDLSQLIFSNLSNTASTDCYRNGTDPESLYHSFKLMNKSQINKINAANKSKSDITAQSYFELGLYLYNCWGNSLSLSSSPSLSSSSSSSAATHATAKADEQNGIMCLSKAGSMGNIDAMEQLGEIYSTKSKHRKKDLPKAAAWLRCAEIFGVKSIGNSWIYKDKYVRIP